MDVYADLLRKRITTETEREFLRKQVQDWNNLLDCKLGFYRSEFQHKLEILKLQNGGTDKDLGNEFNDYRLNMRVKLLSTGEERAVFSSELVNGGIQFNCDICNISVSGKRNMDSHMTGKRHCSKLGEFEIVGTY